MPVSYQDFINGLLAGLRDRFGVAFTLQPVAPYPQSSPVYQQPIMTYQQPMTAYQQPALVYPQSAPLYQQPVTTYPQPILLPSSPPASMGGLPLTGFANNPHTGRGLLPTVGTAQTIPGTPQQQVSPWVNFNPTIVQHQYNQVPLGAAGINATMSAATLMNLNGQRVF